MQADLFAHSSRARDLDQVDHLFAGDFVCPTCGAMPWHPCEDTGDLWNNEWVRVHPARIRAMREASENRQRHEAP